MTTSRDGNILYHPRFEELRRRMGYRTEGPGATDVGAWMQSILLAILIVFSVLAGLLMKGDVPEIGPMIFSVRPSRVLLLVLGCGDGTISCFLFSLQAGRKRSRERAYRLAMTFAGIGGLLFFALLAVLVGPVSQSMFR